MGRCTGHMTHGDERFNCSRASGHLGRCVCRMKVYPEGSFIEKPYGNVMKEGARALGTIEMSWPPRLGSKSLED